MCRARLALFCWSTYGQNMLNCCAVEVQRQAEENQHESAPGFQSRLRREQKSQFPSLPGLKAVATENRLGKNNHLQKFS